MRIACFFHRYKYNPIFHIINSQQRITKTFFEKKYFFTIFDIVFQPLKELFNKENLQSQNKNQNKQLPLPYFHTNIAFLNANNPHYETPNSHIETNAAHIGKLGFRIA